MILHFEEIPRAPRGIYLHDFNSILTIDELEKIFSRKGIPQERYVSSAAIPPRPNNARL
ncbi:hypothetical protein D918_05452 [Trichuris suis]|nr:hypothetical protein D918_05452 [Trichuris suis]